MFNINTAQVICNPWCNYLRQLLLGNIKLYQPDKKIPMRCLHGYTLRVIQFHITYTQLSELVTPMVESQLCTLYKVFVYQSMHIIVIIFYKSKTLQYIFITEIIFI